MWSSQLSSTLSFQGTPGLLCAKYRTPCVPPCDRACGVFSSTPVSVWTAKWNRRRSDSLAAICLQIAQTVSSPFWKKRISVWLSENSCHPWAKLIVTIHMFCSGCPERKTCLMPVHTTQPKQPHVWQVSGWGRGLRRRAGEHCFQFHVTPLAWNTSWNNMTQRKNFYVKLCGFENCSTEYFMIFLSRPRLITVTYRRYNGFFLMKTWTFPIAEKPQEMQHFKSHSLGSIFSAEMFVDFLIIKLELS